MDKICVENKISIDIKGIPTLNNLNKIIVNFQRRDFVRVVDIYKRNFSKFITNNEVPIKVIMVEAYLVVASSYVELGEFENALNILDNYSEKEVESFDLNYKNIYLNTYYDVYCFIGDYSTALKYAEKIISINDENFEKYLKRGYVFLGLKKLKEAEVDLLKAKALVSNYQNQINSNLIHLYLEMENYKLALQYCEESIKNTNGNIKVLMQYLKIGILSKLNMIDELADQIKYLFNNMPFNNPKYYIAIVRLEGKKVNEIYPIVIKEFLKLTTDERYRKIN